MTLAELLKSYEKQLNCSISLEAVHRDFSLKPRLKLAPDQYLHHTDFCRQAKLRDGNRICGGNKRRSIEIAARGRCFRGRCPLGVWEFAQPVLQDGVLAAIVYFGVSANPGEPEPPEKQRKKIQTAAAFVAEFIRQELTLSDENDGRRNRRGDEDFYVDSCRRFIDRRYLDNIALADLSELLGRNSNYLGALLKRRTGRTFRELLTEQRLQAAIVYLQLHRSLSVTEVAFRCGFRDANYFSTVFRRRFGVAPSQHREQKSVAG